MTNAPRPGPLRHLLAARLTGPLLAVLLLAILSLAPPAVVPASASAGAAGRAGTAGTAGAAAYDAGLRAGDCDLLGREYVAGRGCSRTRCIDGAVLWRRTFGAEACALRHGTQGYGFAATVDVRLCQALNRRWIDRVNYCASEPDRSPGALFNAPQCVGAATVYVPLEETEGFYDECLTLERATELIDQAARDGSTLQAEVALRSETQCPLRPGHVYAAGVCVADPSATPSGGGVLMIGDSLTWRGSDELGRLRPAFTLDGEPARPPTELARRLDLYRARSGQPDGLIIELGTVPAKRFGRRDLERAVRSLPPSTRVMLIQPYYELGSHPLVVTPQSKRVDAWMRALARSRPRTCAADWPAYLRAHPGTLQDGVHVKHAAEGRWARWVSQQWDRC